MKPVERNPFPPLLAFALLVLLIGSERVRQVFPPVVTGPVIVVIGLTLAPVAVEMAGKD